MTVIDRKTPGAPSPVTSATPIPGATSNILRSFRSINYIWSLLALDKTASMLGATDLTGAFTVLTSAGKSLTEYDNVTVSPSTDGTVSDPLGELNAFKAKSPGKFDLFIDNVVVDTVLAANYETGMPFTFNMSFEVFEPYSFEGFYQALSAGAMAKGWDDYRSCIFYLKLDFIGYPDSDYAAANGVSIEDAMVIPNTSRIFAIKIRAIETNLDESGTRHQVVADPYSVVAMDNLSSLPKDLKISGSTVGQALDDLQNQLNSIYKNQSDTNKDTGANVFSKVSIQTFPIRETGSPRTGASTGPLYGAKMRDLLGEPNNFLLSSTFGSNSRMSVSSGVLNFRQGQTISEVIESIIKDSSFVRNEISKSLQGNTEFVNIFSIRPYVKVEDFDQTNRTYTLTRYYEVYPYQVPSSLISGNPLSTNEVVKSRTLRQYDYFYTGKNTEILKCELRTDLGYYVKLPSFINQQYPTQKGSAVPNADATDSKIQPYTADSQVVNNGAPLTKSLYDPGGFFDKNGRGGKLTGSPERDLALTLFDTLKSDQDTFSISLEILGDPFYISTSHVGPYVGDANDVERSDQPGLTSNGEADVQENILSIYVKFNVPYDIGADGFVKFSQDPSAFSSYYWVKGIRNVFNNGSFVQQLDCRKLSFGNQTPPLETPNDIPTLPVSYNRIPNKNEIPRADTQPTQVSILDTVSVSNFQTLVNDVKSDAEKYENQAASLLVDVSRRAQNFISGSLNDIVDSVKVTTGKTYSQISSEFALLNSDGGLGQSQVVLGDIDSALTQASSYAVNAVAETIRGVPNSYLGIINSVAQITSRSLDQSPLLQKTVASVSDINRLVSNVPSYSNIGSAVNKLGIDPSVINDNTVKFLPPVTGDSVAPSPILSSADQTAVPTSSLLQAYQVNSGLETQKLTGVTRDLNTLLNQNLSPEFQMAEVTGYSDLPKFPINSVPNNIKSNPLPNPLLRIISNG